MDKLKKHKFLYLIIGLLISIFVFLTANFKGIEEGDTMSYLDVALNGFNSDSIRFRPILYPLVLKLSFILNGSSNYECIVLIQIIFYILASIVFLYIVVNDHWLSRINAVLISVLVILSLLSPNTIASNSLILPEILPLTFLLLVAYFTAKEVKNIFESVLYGIVLIIPALFKPLWLLLLIIPLSKLIWKHGGSKRYWLNIIFPISLAISAFVVHQAMIKKSIKGGYQLASTMDVNLNLALIRCGITTGTEGTKLYQYLSEKGLLDRICNRKWDNSSAEFNEFTIVKDSIPWEQREDAQYWRKALADRNNFFIFTVNQSKRILRFYTNSATDGSIQIKARWCNYVYQSFYHWIHKLLVFPVFIFLLISIIWKKEQGVIVVFWIITFITSIILAILTYQDPHFTRMRIAVEPILLFLTLYGCWRIFEVLKLSIIKFPKTLNK